MQFRRVRNDESDIRRYVAECWNAYYEDLTEVVPGHALKADLNRQAVIEHYQDFLGDPSNRLWVAIDGGGDSTAPLASIEGPVAGFVRTSLSPAPWMFDWPDRLTIHDIWVQEAFRGSGVAEELVGRVVQQAREDGCDRLTLNVALDNERAVALFESLGFEPRGFRMRVPLEDIALNPGDCDLLTGGGSSLQLRRIRVEEDIMQRFVTECWVPFWRALGDAVGEHHLVEDLDHDRLVEEMLEEYDVPDRRCWAVLAECADPMGDLAQVDAVFAGWVNAGHDPGDRFLDVPERLFIGNLYVSPDYRGSGLADRLVERVVQYAREEGCTELTLAVETANERASAYYEKLGFDPFRQRMSVPLDAIDLL